MYKEKWQQLSSSRNPSGYRFIRFNEEVELEFYLGIDREQRRLVSLHLPKDTIFDKAKIERKNISMEYIHQNSMIVARLENEKFIDVFQELISFIYNRIKQERDYKIAFSEFVQSFIKWEKLFDKKEISELSDEVIFGIWGELYFLREKIRLSDKKLSIIEAWRGPFGAAKDFTFNSHHVEIKCKSPENKKVRISSEYQLQSDDSKEIYLKVYTLSKNAHNLKSESILDIFNEIKEEICDDKEALNLFLHAINMLPISLASPNSIDKIRLTVMNNVTFKCDESFPRLTQNNTDIALTEISYSIEIERISNWIYEGAI